MRRLTAGIALVAALATAGAAVAASDFGKQREADMKTIGGSVGIVYNMVQGKTDFDAAKAKAALEKVAATATAFATLFPPGSENADGRASPSIWKNKAEFDAHVAKLASDATAAAAASGSLDTLAPALQTVASNCNTCHKLYRLGRG